MLLFISIMDSTSIRDPKKRDVIQIANIEGDRLIKFPYLALLEEKFARSTYSRYSNVTSEYLIVYSVVLLNSTHRKRIKIGGFDTKNEAKKMIFDVSKKYSKEIVKFSPQVSLRTKNKR